MKNRRFPYGYKMENGRIVTDTAEAQTVKHIFSQYLAGGNLQNIADALTKRRVEYLPGEYVWNKSRIKRIIEDVRYLGNDTYPAVIDADTFRRANAEKDSRRTYTNPTVTAEDKRLTSMAVCGECGGKLFHRTDNTQKHRETWYCKSGACKYGIQMTIAELQAEITELLNRLIADPTLAESVRQEAAAESSLEIKRMENEIERSLDALNFQKEEIQNMILQCAAKKYQENKSARHITDRLKADLEQSSPLSEFNMELFDRTVSAVIMEKDRTIRLRLKNHKIIGKELTSHDEADGGYAENS